MSMMRLFFGTLLLTGMHSLVADQASTPPGKPPAAPKPIEIPMEMLGNRPLIRISVNKQGPFPFLVGPEHEQNLIDPTLVKELRLQSQASRAGVPQYEIALNLGSQSITVAAEAQDMARYAPEFGPTARRGILSLSAWKDQLVTMNYAGFRVVSQPGSLPEPNGQDVFPVSAGRELQLTLSIGERAFLCRIDSLFPGGLLLPASVIKQLPLKEPPRDSGSIQTKDGAIAVREARLATNVLLGPFAFDTPLVHLGGTGEIATVGMQWLSRFSITYDVANGRARIERPRVP
jgi:hypothetical protein